MNIVMESGERLAYTLDIKRPACSDIVLIVHGTFCCRNDRIYVEISENLHVNSLRMDLIGSGDSEGEFSVGNYEGEVACIKKCAEWCQNSGFNVIALIGHSKGANEALMYSSLHSDIPNIILLAARFDTSKMTPIFQQFLEQVQATGSYLLEWNGKKHLITLKGIQEKYDLDVKSHCNNAKGNFLIIHGTSDKVIPTEDSTSIYESLNLTTKKLEILPEVDHMFTGNTKEISIIINNFLQVYSEFTLFNPVNILKIISRWSKTFLFNSTTSLFLNSPRVKSRLLWVKIPTWT